jgi:Arc/MetJ-type ribon-helix-helix transcriptional regulator
MEVHLSAELQAKIDQWVSETGRPVEELIEDAFAGYVPELEQTREMLDSRYDDLKSGRVKPIDGEEAFARLKAMSEARRNAPA